MKDFGKLGGNLDDQRMIREEPMELTLGKAITLAATTGVLTAVLTQLLTGGREWWVAAGKKKTQAGYHALQLAVILEAHAYACAKFIMDNGNAQTPPDQEFPEWNVKLPELPQYPNDAEGWRAIDLQLAASALDLRNRISGSQADISSTIEFTVDELGETLDQQAAGRGLEAWEIAVALRRRHGVDPVELTWDFVEYMKNALQSAEEGLKEARDINSALGNAAVTAVPPKHVS
jgi:hypothetical protein